jgi:hypothetical protein
MKPHPFGRRHLPGEAATCDQESTPFGWTRELSLDHLSPNVGTLNGWKRPGPPGRWDIPEPSG